MRKRIEKTEKNPRLIKRILHSSHGGENHTERNRFTRMCIGEAVSALMREKPYGNITISEIVKRAGVSRMTYYHYYHSIEEVLRDYLHEVIVSYRQEWEQSEDMHFHEYRSILHALCFFDRYAEFFLQLTEAGLYSLIIDALNQYMTELILPQYDGTPYELYYYAGALLNVFIKWEEGGKQESAKEIAKRIAVHVGTEPETENRLP